MESLMGRPLDCFFDQTANGSPYVRVPFEVSGSDGNKKKVNWTGWLTVKAMDRTINNLIKLGLERGGFKRLTNGETGSKVINTEKEIEVTVRKQVDENNKVRTDSEGKPYWEVGFIGAVEHKSNPDVMDKLKSLNFEARLQEAYDKINKPTGTQNYSTDDIPF